MKRLKLTKIIVSSLIVVSALALNPIGASAEWKENSIGWWYTEGDSWVTGWRQINGAWYYFYDTGYMAKDTTIEGYYLDSIGAWTTNIPTKYRMLTNSFSNVTNIQINYNNKNQTINDKELIKKIYDSIMTTKTYIYINPTELESQEGDPIYTIEINYNDGKSDLIESTETGQSIFRIVGYKGSWTGGQNTELINLISNQNLYKNTSNASTRSDVSTTTNVNTTSNENSNSSIVTFADKNLEQLVRDTIKKPTGALYKSDVEKITDLYSKDDEEGKRGNISNLSGIESLINLKHLGLRGNQIRDISALKGLTNLTVLELSRNSISDISSLKKLTNLTDLWLQNNQISDISALKGLTNLKDLDLENNPIDYADKLALKRALPNCIIWLN